MHTTAREAAEITIEGVVQGVGFRDFTRRHAAELGLVGWVMNLSDGRVRAWAEGPRPSIETLMRRLERGPRLCRVDRVAVVWGEASGAWLAFTIRDGNPAR